ncbi:TonB-dependent receptor domain-containing protein [Vibrio sp. 10N.261.51.F12]|uniref:TonB-dependent receptor domain-containing protein n=1 Tax=Vibrio sp. 10N.261.51.F12 TaxID=3229679 RepID=UPI00354C1A9B
MNKSFLAIAVAASLSSYASFSLAQEQAPASTADDTMIVTANRVEQTKSSVLASTTVMTRADIETIKANSILDVLKTVPGIEINSSGGNAQETSIYIRGTLTKHALVLLDGVRLNSATNGGASIGLIPAFAIERIEVVRGPRAAVYGSDAIGGVINITTASSTDNHEARVGYGSNNTKQLGWRSTGAISENTTGGITLQAERSDGYNIYQMSPESDSHGYDSQVVIGNLKHIIDDNWSLKFNGLSSLSHVEYANSFDGSKQESESNNYQLAGEVNYKNESYLSEFQVSTSYNNGKDGDAAGTAAKSELTSTRNSILWANTYTGFKYITLNAGLDYYLEKANRGGSNTQDYGKTSKDNKAAFMTALFEYDKITLDGSVRRDEDSAFGNHNTWNVGAGYFVTDSVQILASSGSAFKAPTFNDLYWPNAGNENLKPETSQSSELGIRGYHQLIEWEISAYQTDIKDLIDWAPNQSGIWTPSNVDNASVKGIELQAKFSTWLVNHRISADFKDPVNEKDGSQLIRRAKQNYKLVSDFTYDDFSTALIANYVGERKDKAGGTLDPYLTVDIALGYQINSQFDVSLKANNLFDEEIFTALGSNGNYYKAQGRNFFATAGYKF